MARPIASSRSLDQSIDLSAIRIMVVEDEPLLCSLLSGELEDSGFTVIETGNADEALRHCASGSRPDLVITDIKMPGPMNGIDLARQLQRVFPALPVIITSGDPGKHSIHDFSHFLQKPYGLDHAVDLVFETLSINRPHP